MAETDTNHLLDIADRIVQHAKRFGADAADAVIVEAQSTSVDVRLGKLDQLDRSEGQDLGLRVFVGESQAIVSTNDFSDPTLQTLAERAVAMARVSPPDPMSRLPDTGAYAKHLADLDLFDGTAPSAADIEALAREAEDVALAVPGVTNSDGAGASHSIAGLALVTSNGFAGSYRRSGFSVYCSVVAGEGTGMERDYESSSAVHLADLRSPDEIGRVAAERAVRRLKPRKVGSRKGIVVYEPRIARSLVGALLSAINGSSIARGTSFLIDAMGTPILPDDIVIVDDPRKPRGLRSRPFDGEGLAGAPRELVSGGVLKTWILDTRSARKLGLTSTGHAARGASSPPSPSPTNVTLRPGSRSRAELIADIDDGLWVTELMGSGVNLVTGDYSLGAAGFWIERGEITYPVAEITIAGNLRSMFRSLAVADDIEYRGGIDTPSVRIEGMTIAGR
ncbi:TldD/PmbA family protein [Rhodoligotrophos defluvii]|uniref:TldD/PmbA family protein n=1 Tax=Rhodoligotrophos defluvii TaxID=2561934 RepID=UPI0010C97EBD|nr:TldD/PmbA family protein [Rhodoligotrophos defluvii]